MEMIRDHNYPRPLHNFNLPLLRWGNQKHMMCLKDSDHSSSSSSSSSIHCRSALPSLHRTRFAITEEDGDEIDAVRERLMSDLRTETDKIKEELLKGGEEEEDEMEEERATRKLSHAAAIARRQEEYEAAEAKTWNLRTRRAACKAPVAKNGPPAKKEEMAETEKALPEKKKKERKKFSAALKKMEIEEDFRKLTGHRPPRQPKKRRRAVQKQLDMLFPGLWLTEITSDAYKVVEVPDTDQR